MAEDTALKDHQAWIGYLQPDGLVVSAAALVDSGVVIDRGKLAEHQQAFTAFTNEIDIDDKSARAIINLADFLCGFLEWRKEYLAGLDGIPIPDELSVPLPEFGETLSPTFALKNSKPPEGAQPWLILIKQLPNGTDLDAAHSGQDERWSASASRRFERLLRETRIPIGIISNGISVRLIYAPHGENSGSVTFPVGAMCEVAGRPILGALHLLFRGYRLYAAPSEERLTALLRKSREYQSSVSTALAGQVLDALYELLRGFQAADERVHRELLKEQIRKSPDQIYAGLLTVLLRLVFLLYAEDRDIMPRGPLYVQNYSVHGLFEKLQGDFECYPDTIDQRYGAWPRLLAVFRAVYGGSKHPLLKMPARKGYLFDPDRYPFLEGRTDPTGRLPLVSDGVIFRVLRNLLILYGERLSYRTLDVEQIGSVYQTMMGFRLEPAAGISIALKPSKAHGAPAAINLEALLGETDRAKKVQDDADCKMSGPMADAVRQAKSIDDLLAALEKRIARNATPSPAPKGGLLLQPSDERRRTGSHYTPRSLTQPIAETTLRPLLEALGERPTPAQILDLKICDLALGSGAFLVEACRQLAEHLVEAWHAHNDRPYIPPDEDETLHARRIIAQRCLYGVDKNPMAVDLAKLSLWLATLARQHPFTFLDHNLRSGDSLVGLRRKQIADFHWKEEPQRVLGQDKIENRIRTATASRKEILEADDELVSPDLKRQKLELADEALNPVRLAGDSVLAAFFSSDIEKERLAKRDEMLRLYAEFPKAFDQLDRDLASLRSGRFPIQPFYWEIEFPEVFDRTNGGFDAIVGNPPFSGVVQLARATRDRFPEFLREYWAGISGQTDLVAFFFRRSFDLLRQAGCLGLLATNTIAQGDTRESGLSVICESGGEIYEVTKRIRWPGQASVIVSRVHISKGKIVSNPILSGRPVKRISAFLFHSGGDRNPLPLHKRPCVAGKGIVPWGMGFVFEDGIEGGPSLREMEAAVAANPSCSRRIHRFIGGADLNSTPDLTPNRFIIDLDGLEEEQAKKFPELFAILERYVRPQRLALPNTPANRRLRERWWHYSQGREIREATRNLDRVLLCSQTSKRRAFAFVNGSWVFDQKAIGFACSEYAFFAAMQSRPHEIWSDFFGSTMKDDPVYTPPKCFDTFAFPDGWRSSLTLNVAGKTYYEFRADLMLRNDDGLTATYNRFHDPVESASEILKLRELHAAMDRAVLDAYGWTDVPTKCEFILDYEEAEEDDSRRRKPWRYRWPDEVRDEVLGRLLALNAQRAEQERLSGAAADGHTKNKKQSRGAKRVTATQASLQAVKIEE